MGLDVDGLMDDLKAGRLKDDRETAAELFFALGAQIGGASEEQQKDMAAARRLWRAWGDDAEKCALQTKYARLIMNGIPESGIGAARARVDRIIFAILHNNEGVTPGCLDAFIEIGYFVGASDGDVDEIILRHVPGASNFIGE